MRFFIFFVLSVGLLIGEPSLEAASSNYSPSNKSLLDEIQHRAFFFLWKEANPKNGLVKDRAGNFESDNYSVASIASVGFALASIPIAIERQWISRREGYHRVLKTLEFFKNRAQHKRGFFYHFYGMNSEKRVWKSEISSIDTALLLAGAIVAREYFQDFQITRRVNHIYNRINFKWMMDGGSTLTMGWKPENGFLKERWANYDEGILLTLLAMGANKHSIPPDTWDNIRRRRGIYEGITLIQSPPLFTHQYPQLFFDLREKHDSYVDYYRNSTNATRANQLYCRKNQGEYETYRNGYWGLTACDGPGGYKAYGAEPGGAVSDGTVAPTAAITSIMFTPEASLDFIKKLHSLERNWLWGRYGFADSFNLKNKWRSPDVIGIDQGAILLGIENYRTGLIWKLFSNAPEGRRALRLAKFQPGSQEVTLPETPQYAVKRMGSGWSWQTAPSILLSSIRYLELGNVTGPDDLNAEIQFAWDSRYLHFKLQIQDDVVMTPKGKDGIWKNDCLEIFVDSLGEGLVWGNRRHFQIGFSPTEDLKSLKTWAWFQERDPVKNNWVEARIQKSKTGYEIIGRIKWTYLNITPRLGETLSITPAFHDLDEDGSEEKYAWHFLSKNGRFELGKLILK